MGDSKARTPNPKTFFRHIAPRVPQHPQGAVVSAVWRHDMTLDPYARPLDGTEATALRFARGFYSDVAGDAKNTQDIRWGRLLGYEAFCWNGQLALMVPDPQRVGTYWGLMVETDSTKQLIGLLKGIRLPDADALQVGSAARGRRGVWAPSRRVAIRPYDLAGYVATRAAEATAEAARNASAASQWDLSGVNRAKYFKRAADATWYRVELWNAGDPGREYVTARPDGYEAAETRFSSPEAWERWKRER